MSNLYLGVDGGGTKTKAVVLDEYGKILGFGESSGSNYHVFGIETTYKNIFEAVTNALQNNHNNQVYACFALAGVNFPSDMKILQNILIQGRQIVHFAQEPLVVNDIVAALRSGTTDKNAIAVISGTGSNCYGRNEEGLEVRVGGQDYILSDEGSGYAIGLEVLKTVTKSLDGRISTTRLTDLLFEHLQINSLEQLAYVIYQKKWDKRDISMIAPLAHIAAKQDDIYAQRIIRNAASELLLLAQTAVNKLSLRLKPFTVVTSGSVFKNFDLIFSQFETELKKFAPYATVSLPKIESAYAAALLAVEYFGTHSNQNNLI